MLVSQNAFTRCADSIEIYLLNAKVAPPRGYRGATQRLFQNLIQLHLNHSNLSSLTSLYCKNSKRN